MASAKEDFDKLSSKLMEKTKDYLQSEMRCTVENYQLLETMNDITSKKYNSLCEKTNAVTSSIEQVNKLCRSLSTHFDQIDKLDEKVSRLEEMAFSIDGYTKRLETQFKKYSSTAH